MLMAAFIIILASSKPVLSVSESQCIIEAHNRNGLNWLQMPVVFLFSEPLSDLSQALAANNFASPVKVIDKSDDLRDLAQVARLTWQNIFVFGKEFDEGVKLDLIAVINDIAKERQNVWLAIPSEHFNSSTKNVRFDAHLLLLEPTFEHIVFNEAFGRYGDGQLVTKKLALTGCNANNTNGNASLSTHFMETMAKRRGPFLKNETLNALLTVHTTRDGHILPEDQVGWGSTNFMYKHSLVVRDLISLMREELELNIDETSVKEALKQDVTSDTVFEAMLNISLSFDFDLIADALYEDQQRRVNIDFSLQTEKNELCIATAMEGVQNFSNTYLDVFTPKLWLTLVTTLLALATAIAFADRFQNAAEEERGFLGAIMNWCIILVLLFIQRDATIENRRLQSGNMAKKLLLLMTSMLLYILFSLYTSSLTSMLTVVPVETHVFSKLETLTNTRYELRLASRGLADLLKEAKANSIQRRIADRIDINDFSNYLSRAEDVKQFLKDEPDSAWLGTNDVFEAQQSHYGDLKLFTPIDVFSSALTLHIPLKKFSSLRTIVDHQIMRFNEIGLLWHSKNKWVPKKKTQSDGQTEMSLGLENTIWPFAILIFGMILSLCCLMVERALEKRSAKRTKPLLHP